MTKIMSLLMTAAALVAISACGVATLPYHAANHKTAHCLTATVYSYSPAQRKAALRYWTPSNMRSATGFSSASLSGVLGQLRHRHRTPGAAQSACRRSVPAAVRPTPKRG
jgi:hypothetical protein